MPDDMPLPEPVAPPLMPPLLIAPPLMPLWAGIVESGAGEAALGPAGVVSLGIGWPAGMDWVAVGVCAPMSCAIAALPNIRVVAIKRAFILFLHIRPGRSLKARPAHKGSVTRATLVG